MSAEPVAVLLVPPKHKPGPLLERGACLSAAPFVTLCCGEWAPRWVTIGLEATALPLWWDGDLVPDGWWRLWLAWTGGGRQAGPCPLSPTLSYVRQIAREYVEEHAATRIVLLHHVDGHLVERAP
jgi:hypothetical protein